MRKQVLAATIAVLLVLSVFSVLRFWQIKLVQATTIFSDGFESGTTTAWTSNTTDTLCNITITTSSAIYGSYGADLDINMDGWNGWAYLTKTFADASTVFARGYFNLSGSALGTDPRVCRFIDFQHFPTDIELVNIYRNTTGYYWELDYVNGADATIKTYATPAPTLNTVYCVEIAFVFSNTVGAANLWIDGSNIISITDIDTIGTYSHIDRADMGCVYLNGDPANINQVDFDSAIIADTYIGPESGTHYLTINSLPIAVPYTINGTVAGASEVTASSGSPSDIQTAINTIVAAGGGTVYIPAGTFTFNPSPVNITYTTVPINIIGAGIGVTILQETVNPSAQMMFRRLWAGATYSGGAVRISGISFVGYVVNEATTGNIAISLFCTQDFRIDHCSFQDFVDKAIGISANNGDRYRLVNRGVIDHCSFDNPYKYGLNINAALWGYGIVVTGIEHIDAGSWDPNISHYLGQNYNTTTYNGWAIPSPIYIENCNFSRCRHAISANGGGYYVSRYNYFEKSAPYGANDAHGNAGDGMGTRGMECYSNTYNFTDESYSFGQDAAVEPRGGGGVTWNNTVILNPSYSSPTVQFGNDGEVYPYDVRSFYIWNNSAQWINGTAVSFNSKITTVSGVVEGTNYFLRQPDMTNDSFTYTPYTYPHPLAVITSAGSTNSTIALTTGTYVIMVVSQTSSGGYTYNFSHWQDASTNASIIVSLTANATITATYIDITVVSVSISLPTNTTYDTPTISVSFSATGGTIDQKWFNVKNGTSWIYTSNQTYPDFETMTGFINGTQYTFYAFANNTDGTQGQATVMFSVQIPIQPAGGTTSIIINVWWSQFW